MLHQQMSNEVKYKAALLFLNELVSKGMLTQKEYEQVDRLNKQLYVPQWAEVYL